MAERSDPPDIDETDSAADPSTSRGTENEAPAEADEPASETAASDGGTQTGLPAEEAEMAAEEARIAAEENALAAETTTGSGSTPPAESSVDDGVFGEGPESDQEMPLADHIEEMMRRLGAVFLIAGIAMVVTYPFAADLINYLWSTHIPDADFNRPRLYGPLEFILTKLKVAGLAGLLLGLPMFVYQTYRFMKPGLYANERRYYLAAVPTSLILGIAGVLFAHFLVLPFIFAYFTTYTAEAAVIAFGLQETFNLILIMMGWMAIIFQIPLFIMLAIMMGLVPRQWLEAKRLIFWGVFLGVAFVFSPDPTGMAPIIVTLTMIALFEGTLALLRWTGN